MSRGGPKCAMHFVCMTLCVIKKVMERLGACFIGCASSHTIAVVSFWQLFGLGSFSQNMRKTEHIVGSYMEFNQMSIGGT